jgi:hypothetical protein
MPFPKSNEDLIKKSIPIMTLARRVACPYYFPIPSFELYSHAEIPGSGGSWEDVFYQLDTYIQIWKSTENLFLKVNSTFSSEILNW